LKHIFSLSLLISFVIFTSCKEKVTNAPDTPLPEGYQQDVLWPSLADSPWPIVFGDPQWTKRSKGIGACQGVIEEISLPYANQTGISIGVDSTIYYTAVKYNNNDTSGLVAIGLDGKVKWIYNMGNDFPSLDPGSPIVASDGTIYTTTTPDKRKIYAINKDGTLKWEIDNAIYHSYLNLGKDGTLYLFNGRDFAAVSKEGSIKWNLSLDGYRDRFLLSPDGKLAYFNDPINGWLALNLETQIIEWRSLTTLPAYSGALIDYLGNIYSLSSAPDKQNISLYKMNKNGSVLWELQLAPIKDSPLSIAISKMGDCYACVSDTLYSVSYNGNLNWKIPLGDCINGEISTDANSNCYFAVSERFDSQLLTYQSVDKNGKILWKTDNANFNFYGIIFPLAIANNYTYAIGYRGYKILKIK